MAETNTQISVRAVLGKNIGVASTNDLAPEALQRIVERALTIARFQRENADYPGLPGPAAYQRRRQLLRRHRRGRARTPRRRRRRDLRAAPSTPA